MFKFVSTKNSSELFHRAIVNNDIARTKLILEEAMRDPRFNIDEINDEGLTALQFSCFAGNLEIVKVLKSYKANYRLRDRDGYTMLHAAAMAGNAEVVRFLLKSGLKPTLRADDGNMPIDTTDEISIIVILLRAMLDQGYLQEMQEYMTDHPKLKSNIFQELKDIKCKEQERNDILKDLPYTSHTTERKAHQRAAYSRQKNNLNRSLSTFAALSDSMQHLDMLDHQRDSNNNNKALNRLSSCSSKSSSSSGGGGILRNDSHASTQQYLESRFPPKSVKFEMDQPAEKSDGYASDNSTDFGRAGGSTISRTSSCSSRSSSGDNFEPFQRLFEEPLYENTQPGQQAQLPTISENYYENMEYTHFPPPIPPREPMRASLREDTSNTYVNNGHYEDMSACSDRQLGSETDSGIDINETQGRMFALSLDERKQNETFSKPMGIFYSHDSRKTTVNRKPSSDDNLPCGYFIRPNVHENSKYKSWNGRSLQKEHNIPQQHNQQTFTDIEGRNYRNINHINQDDVDTFNNKEHVRAMSTGNLTKRTQSENLKNAIDSSSRHEKTFLDYNFDHQQDIML